MINVAITIWFIVLVVLLGKHLFSVGDWGKPKPSPAGERWRERVRRGEFRIDP